MSKNPVLKQRHPAAYGWAMDAYVAGAPLPQIRTGITQLTGLDYHDTTIKTWAQQEGVKAGGDRRRPVPPLPDLRPSDEAQFWAISRGIAQRLGREAPESWGAAEAAAVAERPPADAELCLISGDWQGGFMDPVAMQTRARIVEYFQPTVIVHNGDGFDMYAASRFRKNPELLEVMDLSAEAKLVRGVLAEDRKRAPRHRPVWMNGNHELHLERWMSENGHLIKGLFPEPTVPALIEADAHGIEVRNYLGVNSLPYDFHGLRISHGTFASKVVGGNANTAAAMRRRPGTSGVIGHSHKAELAYHQSGGQLWQWISAGCLAYLAPGMEYFEGAPDGWSQAVCLAWYVAGRLHTQLAVFQEHATVAGGVFFTPDTAQKL